MKKNLDTSPLPFAAQWIALGDQRPRRRSQRGAGYPREAPVASRASAVQHSRSAPKDPGPEPAPLQTAEKGADEGEGDREDDEGGEDDDPHFAVAGLP